MPGSCALHKRGGKWITRWFLQISWCWVLFHCLRSQNWASLFLLMAKTARALPSSCCALGSCPDTTEKEKRARWPVNRYPLPDLLDRLNFSVFLRRSHAGQWMTFGLLWGKEGGIRRMTGWGHFQTITASDATIMTFRDNIHMVFFIDFQGSTNKKSNRPQWPWDHFWGHYGREGHWGNQAYAYKNYWITSRSTSDPFPLPLSQRSIGLLSTCSTPSTLHSFNTYMFVC